MFGEIHPCLRLFGVLLFLKPVLYTLLSHRWIMYHFLWFCYFQAKQLISLLRFTFFLNLPVSLVQNHVTFWSLWNEEITRDGEKWTTNGWKDFWNHVPHLNYPWEMDNALNSWHLSSFGTHALIFSSLCCCYKWVAVMEIVKLKMYWQNLYWFSV
jgi:hypothetical protein